MDVEKIKNRVTNTYDIVLKKDNKIFRMSYEGNLDIYWGVRGKNYDYIDDKYGHYEFVITKENYHIYEAFNNLYHDIIDAQVFDKDIIDECKSIDEYEKELARITRWQQRELKSDVYERLVQDKVITWLSDDAIFNEDGLEYYMFPPAYVSISKKGGEIHLDFKVKLINNRKNMPVAVRFRTNGSSYRYFYIPFILMHQKLQSYEETNQIHLEEYLYLTRKK